MSDQTEKKTESLNNLLVSLRVLENEIDNADEITPELCEAHFSQLTAIDEKVDRLLAYMDISKRNAALYSERAQELEKRAISWEKKLERLEEYALYLVERFPDVAWRGSERSFNKKLNPPSVVIPFKKSYSNANMIPEELVSLIPEKYRKEVTIHVLNSDVIKADLKAGESLDFAKLERKVKLEVSAKLKGDNQ